MRSFRLVLAALLLCALLPCAAVCEQPDIGTLVPIAMPADTDGHVIELYCGPTQGAYRQDEQALDTGKPYVFFGQCDCWAMVAPGTPDSFGPVGWVESALLETVPDEPLLGFEDGFAATVEESAALTNAPLAADPFTGWGMTLTPGTQVVVLAQLGDWLYVQAELEGQPIRAFIPTDTIF